MIMGEQHERMPGGARNGRALRLSAVCAVVVAAVVACAAIPMLPGTEGDAASGGASTAFTESERANDDWGVPFLAQHVGQDQTSAEARDTSAITSELEQLFAGGHGAVTVIDLATSAPILNLAEDEAFTAASTYKLFAVASILQRIDAGDRSWDDAIGGTDAQQCLADTMIWSLNDCIEAWLAEDGFDEMMRLADEIGADDTAFEPFELLTSTRDVAELLRRLSVGELVSDESAELMIEMMKEQVWTERIATALEGEAVVASKPGFLESISHDAALVYGDKGEYVMVIFTEGLSDDVVRSAATAIYDWL